MDTTQLLESMDQHTHAFVIVHIDDRRYRMPAAQIRTLLWTCIPDAIKDENSADAKRFATLRTGLKALIRPFLPDLLSKIAGQKIELTRGLNVLSWLSNFFVAFSIKLLTSREWEIHVRECKECSPATYEIAGLTPWTIDPGQEQQTLIASAGSSGRQSVP